jgi:alpha-tubulin suppressor-like RCC1 family protein
LGNEKTEDRGDEDGETGEGFTKVDLGSNRTATAIAAGNFHTCAILDNSSIKCWGLNDSGQLGIGDTTNRVYLGDDLPAVDLGAGRTARGIAAGDSHTCAMLDNTSIKCWGKNESGQLGLGDTSDRGDGSNDMGDNLPVIGL